MTAPRRAFVSETGAAATRLELVTKCFGRLKAAPADRLAGEGGGCPVDDGWPWARGMMKFGKGTQMSWKAPFLSASKISRRHKITMILPKAV